MDILIELSLDATGSLELRVDRANSDKLLGRLSRATLLIVHYRSPSRQLSLQLKITHLGFSFLGLAYDGGGRASLIASINA